MTLLDFRLSLSLWFDKHGMVYLAGVVWHRCSDCAGWRVYRRIFFPNH